MLHLVHRPALEALPSTAPPPPAWSCPLSLGPSLFLPLRPSFGNLLGMLPTPGLCTCVLPIGLANSPFL